VRLNLTDPASASAIASTEGGDIQNFVSGLVGTALLGKRRNCPYSPRLDGDGRDRRTAAPRCDDMQIVENIVGPYCNFVRGIQNQRRAPALADGSRPMTDDSGVTQLANARKA
jgi:hypothetical protein